MTTDLEKGAEHDRKWFARHPGRSYRLRRPVGHEAVMLGWPNPSNPHVAPMIVVKHANGVHARRICVAYMTDCKPPRDSEKRAQLLFDDTPDGVLMMCVPDPMPLAAAPVR